MHGDLRSILYLLDRNVAR